MNTRYDVLIVGCGFFGATLAQQLLENGYKVLMVDKRNHSAGNCYTHIQEGIPVHTYGAHIFHTDNPDIWHYVNRFATFNHYVNRPKVRYEDKLFSFPINLMTLYQLWNVKTPQEAQAKLEAAKIPFKNPANLEEWALSQVGEEIYTTFIKGYTQKQWGKPPSELPSFIIRRLPIRLTFDDNYFFDRFQGIPIGGYTPLIEAMTQGADIRLNTDYFAHKNELDALADQVIYTGPIDRYFSYEFGTLEYRSVRFDTQVLHQPDFQGNAVINYTHPEVPFTRIIEHKHFEFMNSPSTVITYEYPQTWTPEKEPFYPVNDTLNTGLYQKYKEKAETLPNTWFGGRLAEYKYYDMHQVIASALSLSKKLINTLKNHNNS